MTLYYLFIAFLVLVSVRRFAAHRSWHGLSAFISIVLAAIVAAIFAQIGAYIRKDQPALDTRFIVAPVAVFSGLYVIAAIRHLRKRNKANKAKTQKKDSKST